jgi:hypothetical protein
MLTAYVGTILHTSWKNSVETLRNFIGTSFVIKSLIVTEVPAKCCHTFH